MSLVNLELENKIIEITKKICDPNCKKCKVALITNLENRAKFSNLNKKRNFEELNNYETYYDAIEYNSEYLPNKYRKYTYEQHRTSQVLYDDSKDSQLSSKYDHDKPSDKNTISLSEGSVEEQRGSKDFEESRKRKVQDSDFQKDSELYLENIKKRVLESTKSKKSDTSTKDFEELEYEKFLEQRYYGLLKNVDKSTLVDLVDSESRLGVLKDTPTTVFKVPTVTTDVITSKPFVVDISSPQKIEISPTPENVTPLPLETTTEDKDEDTKTVESTDKLSEEPKDEEEQVSNKDVTFVPTPIDTPKEADDNVETTKPLELPSVVPETKSSSNLFGTTNESTVKNLFSSDTTSMPDSNKSKELFSNLDKFKLDKPVGNPLFAPNKQSLSEFVPKTDGANYVFGQSKQPDKPSGTGSSLPFGGFQSQQPFQDTSLYNQLASSGYGTPLVQQQNPTIFGPGSFKKSKFRGRGRGRH